MTKRLTPEMRHLIAMAYAHRCPCCGRGASMREVGREFGVTAAAVCKIVAAIECNRVFTKR